jgi:hypothetical protein
MRIIDPVYFDKERKLFELELFEKPKSFYKEQEFQNISALYDLLYNIDNEYGFKDVVLKINPHIKMLTVPFVFAHTEENKLRGPLYRDIVLRPTFFTTEDFLIHCYKLGKEINFFKSLFNYGQCFTISSLIRSVNATVATEKIAELEQSFISFTKLLLLEQIFIIDRGSG